MALKITKLDPQLKDFAPDFELRMDNFRKTKGALLHDGKTLSDFANGYLFYGFHQTEDGWYYREWAPAAEAMSNTYSITSLEKLLPTMRNLNVPSSAQVLLPLGSNSGALGGSVGGPVVGTVGAVVGWVADVEGLVPSAESFGLPQAVRETTQKIAKNRHRSFFIIVTALLFL